MKKIALLTSGSILLLGGLFYSLSPDNKQAPGEPAPKAPLSSKPAGITAIVPPQPEIASATASKGNATSEQTDPVADTSDAGVKPKQRQATAIQETANRTSAKRDSSNPKPAEKPTVPSGDEPALSQAPIGLRLAPDVRLPVAAMPLNFKVSPVAQQAINQIVQDYYREIAEGLPTEQSGGAHASNDGLIEEPETGELTRIVTNGPTVDEARERADYRFKALFGNDAYNQMTIRTLLEARTPVNPQN